MDQPLSEWLLRLMKEGNLVGKKGQTVRFPGTIATYASPPGAPKEEEAGGANPEPNAVSTPAAPGVRSPPGTPGVSSPPGNGNGKCAPLRSLTPP